MAKVGIAYGCGRHQANLGYSIPAEYYATAKVQHHLAVRVPETVAISEWRYFCTIPFRIYTEIHDKQRWRSNDGTTGVDLPESRISLVHDRRASRNDDFNFDR